MNSLSKNDYMPREELARLHALGIAILAKEGNAFIFVRDYLLELIKLKPRQFFTRHVIILRQ